MSDVHDKVLFDYDPVTQKRVDMENKDGLLIIHESVPKARLQQIYDENKKAYNAIPHKSYKGMLRKKNMWRVASIPNVIVEKWKREEGIDIFRDEDWPKIQAKLNSDEYKFLRTSPGKV